MYELSRTLRGLLFGRVCLVIVLSLACCKNVLAGSAGYIAGSYYQFHIQDSAGVGEIYILYHGVLTDTYISGSHSVNYTSSQVIMFGATYWPILYETATGGTNLYGTSPNYGPTPPSLPYVAGSLYPTAAGWIPNGTSYSGPIGYTNTASVPQSYMLLVDFPNGTVGTYDEGVLAPGAGSSLTYSGPSLNGVPEMYDSPGSANPIGEDTPIELTPDQLAAGLLVTNWVPVGTPPGGAVSTTVTAPGSTNAASMVNSIGEQESNQALTNAANVGQGIIAAITNAASYSASGGSGSSGSGTNTSGTAWTNGLTLGQLETLLNTNSVSTSNAMTAAMAGAATAQYSAVTNWNGNMSTLYGMTNISSSALNAATNFNDDYEGAGGFLTITLPSKFNDAANLSSGATEQTYDLNIRHNDYYYWGTFIIRSLSVLLLTWRFALALYTVIYTRTSSAWVVPQAVGQSRIEGGVQPLGIGGGASTSSPAALGAALLITYAIFAIPVVIAGAVNIFQDINFVSTIAQSPANVIVNAGNVATGNLMGRHPELSKWLLWSVKCMDDVLPLFLFCTIVVDILFLRFTVDSVYMGVCALIKTMVPIIIVSLVLRCVTCGATECEIFNKSSDTFYYQVGAGRGAAVVLPGGSLKVNLTTAAIQVSTAVGTYTASVYTNESYISYWLDGVAPLESLDIQSEWIYGLNDPETLSENARQTQQAQGFDWYSPFGLGMSHGTILAIILVTIKVYRRFGKSIITGSGD